MKNFQPSTLNILIPALFYGDVFMPSSVVAHMQYNPEAQTLRIIYTSGNIYDYKKVPAEVYEEMKNAFSKGTFLNERIKGKYRYVKIK